MDEAGVFARPAEAGGGSQGALDDRAGVDVATRLKCAELGMQAFFKG